MAVWISVLIRVAKNEAFELELCQLTTLASFSQSLRLYLLL